MNYVLHSVKLAGGEETPRFEAKLSLEGRLLATVSNNGTGGCCDWHWIVREAEAPFGAWAEGQMPNETFEHEDAWVYAQLDKVNADKEYMRVSRTKTVFRFAADEPGTYRTIGRPFDTDVRTFLRAKYSTHAPTVYDRNAKAFVPL